MEIIGYTAAIFIGVLLGLIGGGGSILTVPVLVYLFKIDPIIATAYSLFIIGTTSVVGVIPKYKQGLVHMKTAVIFGIPSIITVFVTRKYLIPLIPENILEIGDFTITKAILTMIVFAILMIAASISMIKKSKNNISELNQNQIFNYPLIIIEGTIVGLLTGFVGAGGGFIIIPALVILSKLPMKMAIGTSLLIIASKSLIGFLGDISTQSYNSTMEWDFLLIFTSLSIIGIFIGNFYSKKVDGEKLKKGFGYFVLIMGVYIIWNELFNK